jgi:hypothetical protein
VTLMGRAVLPPILADGGAGGQEGWERASGEAHGIPGLKVRGAPGRL